MNSKDIRVGIADYKISTSPDSLITVGLGSCVGISIYDECRKIGGLAHIMLPDSTQFNKVTNANKFADLAIPAMVEELVSKGASKYKLRAKIAGGASMFNFSDKSMIMDIGGRNSAAVIKMLKQLSIPIIAEDTGGNKGRTMILNTENGLVSIKTVGIGLKEL